MNRIIILVSTMLFTLLSGINANSILINNILPGDQFDLESVLELFKKSKDPLDFEKLLNQSDEVSNLDLNEDGYIDYIKINVYQDEEIRVFVLQVDLNESEAQDIASIHIEKTGPQNAILQIIGDSDLFSKERIVEPYFESPSFGGKGSSENAVKFDVIVLNVWNWPNVSYVYSPKFKSYKSGWKWKHRPQWWKNRKTINNNHFVLKPRVYTGNYRVYHTHRISRANHVYHPVRKSCIGKNKRKAINKKHSKKRRK